MWRVLRIVGTTAVLLTVAAAVFLVGYYYYVSQCNYVAALAENVEAKGAAVRSAMDANMDLTPSLVNLLAICAPENPDLFAAVSQTRQSYLDPTAGLAAKAKAADDMQELTRRLLTLAADRPDLLTQDLRSLRIRIRGREEYVAFERDNYNAAVERLDRYLKGPFGGFFARRAGVSLPPYLPAPGQPPTAEAVTPEISSKTETPAESPAAVPPSPSTETPTRTETSPPPAMSSQ